MNSENREKTFEYALSQENSKETPLYKEAFDGESEVLVKGRLLVMSSERIAALTLPLFFELLARGQEGDIQIALIIDLLMMIRTEIEKKHTDHLPPMYKDWLDFRSQYDMYKAVKQDIERL